MKNVNEKSWHETHNRMGWDRMGLDRMGRDRVVGKNNLRLEARRNGERNDRRKEKI